MAQRSVASRSFAALAVSVSVVLGGLFIGLTSERAEAAPPSCNGIPATIYVSSGFIVGGPNNGAAYAGTLNGTNGTDIIVGTSGNDTINAFSGSNTVCALGGDDTVTTGNSTDWVDAGDGDDTVNAGAGSNTVNAGDGDDLVTGNGGSDRVTGGNGDDVIIVGAGSNIVNAGAGNDSITGLSGVDMFDGGPGYDFCSPDGGNNIVNNCEGNTSQGIVIIKETDIETEEGFSFSGDLGAFTLGNGDASVFSLSAGTYAVTEEDEAEWLLDDIVCDDPSGGTSATGTTATIDLDPNDVIICTFENIFATRLTVIKNVINAFGGTLTSADFNLKVGWYNGNSNDPGEPWSSFPGSASGTTFKVNPGDFIVGEDWEEGYSAVTDTAAGPRCMGGAHLNAREHLTCTITNKQLAYGGDNPSCGALEGENGWFGEYFNYPKSLPEMYSIYEGEPVPGDDGFGTEKWGRPRDATSTAATWYSPMGPYFRFSRVDSDLEFGDTFWPFFGGLVEETSYGDGRDFHFGVHWRSVVNVPTNGASYQFYGKVEDDLWVYVNGTLYAFPSPAPTGVHGPVGISGALTLSDGDVVDVYYADRAPGGSAMYLEFLNNTDGDGGNDIIFSPTNEACVIEEA